MIGYLRGEILEHSEGKALVLVGGVGYQVAVPQSAEYGALAPGQQVELYVYTAVREDALDLYGFVTRDEKELYLTLLSVNGIGPKGALGILTNVPPATLIQAVMEKDKDMLTKIPGVGKKTAERVVLELGDPLKKKMDAGMFGGYRAVAKGAKAGKGAPAGATFKDAKGEHAVLNDARVALVSLGYRDQEVSAMIARALDAMPEPKKVEDVIKLALKTSG